MKQMYVAPQNEWYEIAVEQGFAATPTEDYVEDPDKIELGN